MNNPMKKNGHNTKSDVYSFEKMDHISNAIRYKIVIAKHPDPRLLIP